MICKQSAMKVSFCLNSIYVLPEPGTDHYCVTVGCQKWSLKIIVLVQLLVPKGSRPPKNLIFCIMIYTYVGLVYAEFFPEFLPLKMF